MDRSKLKEWILQDFWDSLRRWSIVTWKNINSCTFNVKSTLISYQPFLKPLLSKCGVTLPDDKQKYTWNDCEIVFPWQGLSSASLPADTGPMLFAAPLSENTGFKLSAAPLAANTCLVLSINAPCCAIENSAVALQCVWMHSKSKVTREDYPFDHRLLQALICLFLLLLNCWYFYIISETHSCFSLEEITSLTYSLLLFCISYLYMYLVVERKQCKI
jgi:hypothetical protein